MNMFVFKIVCVVLSVYIEVLKIVLGDFLQFNMIIVIVLSEILGGIDFIIFCYWDLENYKLGFGQEFNNVFMVDFIVELVNIYVFRFIQC